MKYKATLSTLLMSKAEQRALKIMAKQAMKQQPKTMDEACKKLRQMAAIKGIAIN